MLEILQFKLDILWSMLDAMSMAYELKRPPYHSVTGNGSGIKESPYEFRSQQDPDLAYRLRSSTNRRKKAMCCSTRKASSNSTKCSIDRRLDQRQRDVAAIIAKLDAQFPGIARAR